MMMIYLMTIAILAFRNRKVPGYFLSNIVEKMFESVVCSRHDETRTQ